MRKWFEESEIINLLWTIEIKISLGTVTVEACRSLGMTRAIIDGVSCMTVWAVRRSSVART